ncbi:mechanosensitive ion channel family protein [Patescibacteria group bacterium]|nr:mechanosensitive ion channel family protein [Patescibacteria group bacterium]
MFDIKEILAYQLGQNTVYDFSKAFLIFIALFLLFKLFETVVVVRLKKIAKNTKNDFDDVLVEIIGSMSTGFYLIVALYFPLIHLVRSELALKIIKAVFLIVVVYQIVRFVQKLVVYCLNLYFMGTRDENDQAITTFTGLRLVVRIVLWATAVLLILSNLGVNINSLIASLGIGGVAVALAVQNILGDIFSSFTIYFDRPFEIGDYIVVGDHDGEVEKIGLKSTRIRTMQGDLLIISNKELTSERIRNFKKMSRRRADFEIGVTYDTSSAKLKKINGLVKKIIEATNKVEFCRSYFTAFGDFSLKFSVIYYVLTPDYTDFLEAQQNINFEIKKAFEKAGIEMAFPTQTVYVQK